MLKNSVYVFVFLASTLFLNDFALADESPTLDQVYQTARSGRLDDAQKMMTIVLKEHPNSAKAHFVEAELLAKQGQIGRAEEELHNAEHLKPDLSFANPQAVQDLRNRIAATHRISQSPVNSMQTAPENSFPWGLLLLGVGVIALIVFVMRAMNARNPATFPGTYQPGMAGSPAAPMPMNPYGGGGMGPMYSGGGGMGSGIMGGLATGAAVGVGMVAGEALAHHFMDGDRGAANAASSGVSPVADSWGNSSNSNMGGADFGIADNSSWEDSSSFAGNSSDVSGSDWS